MMEAVAKLPLSLTERLEAEHTLRLPASWDEFLELLTKCDYRIEYLNGEIFSFMGYASENHEKLVAVLIRLIGNIIGEKNLALAGSNLALHVPAAEKNYFNADCTVVKGATKKIQLSANMHAVANPILLVEVLSDSTAAFDLTTKAPLYRQIPSLQQLLFVDSAQMSVTSMKRDTNTEDWVVRDFRALENQVDVLNLGHISLADIYRKIKL